MYVGGGDGTEGGGEEGSGRRWRARIVCEMDLREGEMRMNVWGLGRGWEEDRDRREHVWGRVIWEDDRLCDKRRDASGSKLGRREGLHTRLGPSDALQTRDMSQSIPARAVSCAHGRLFRTVSAATSRSQSHPGRLSPFSPALSSSIQILFFPRFTPRFSSGFVVISSSFRPSIYPFPLPSPLSPSAALQLRRRPPSSEPCAPSRYISSFRPLPHSSAASAQP